MADLNTNTQPQSNLDAVAATTDAPGAYIHVPYKYRATIPDPDADDRASLRHTLIWDLCTITLMLLCAGAFIWLMEEYGGRGGQGQEQPPQPDPPAVYNGILK